MPAVRRPLGAVIAAVALGVTGLLSGGNATAAPNPEPPSTPVPIATPDGTVMSYVLNAKKANENQTRKLEQAVVRSGGVVVQSWPQIGVVVAHSDRQRFRQWVTDSAGNALESVGATRTVGVTEGTPTGIATPWHTAARPAAAPVTKRATGGISALSGPAAVTVDPRESEQWDMTMIKADQAHQITDGSRKVLVGVLDSGIDPDHPDLVANIDVANSVNCSNAGRPDTSATGWYPTTSDHGNHVAGTIAAARNGVGIVGVAPGVRLAAVKVVNNDGFIYPEYAVCGFIWAGQHKMDVTNNSYYVDPFEFYCDDQPDQHAAKEAVRRAVAWSTGQGVVHAAAAGNSALDLTTNRVDKGSPDDGDPIDRTLNRSCEDIPTQLPGVATVSSVTKTRTLSYFSNRGLSIIDVTAPGSSVLSTIVSNNGYGNKSGTSMASPHVAGVLALMKSAHPTYTPAQLVNKLRADAVPLACSAPEFGSGSACVGMLPNNSYFGMGMIDALAAVR